MSHASLPIRFGVWESRQAVDVPNPAFVASVLATSFLVDVSPFRVNGLAVTTKLVEANIIWIEHSALSEKLMTEISF